MKTRTVFGVRAVLVGAAMAVSAFAGEGGGAAKAKETREKAAKTLGISVEELVGK